jgi:hypothetical protein
MEWLIFCGLACLLLAKQGNKQDLGFLQQMSLGGINAVEMLKSNVDGVDCQPYEILIGKIGDLGKKFDIPIDSFKLDPGMQAMLLFDLQKDRPLFVHQKTAQGAMHVIIHQLNIDDKVESVEDYYLEFTADKSIIGKLLKFTAKNGKPECPNLNFVRESGKFGKWKIN